MKPLALLSVFSLWACTETPMSAPGPLDGSTVLATPISPPREAAPALPPDAAVPAPRAPLQPSPDLAVSAAMGMIGFQVPEASPPDRPLPPCRREIPIVGADRLVPGLQAALPGDCLILAEGNYNAGKISVQGTAEAPIVVRGRRQRTATVSTGQLVVQGAAHLVFEGLTLSTPSTIKMIDNHDVRFSRCVFALTVQDDWVLVYGTGSHHNRFDRNEFGPKVGPGPFLVLGQNPSMSQHDRIDWNYFHDNGPPAVNEKESIRVGESAVSRSDGFAIIENNLFQNCDGDPEIVSLKTNQNIVRHNTFRSSAGVLSARHGNNSFLYGNFILGGDKTAPCVNRAGMATTCETGGIRIYGRGHKIFNNYIAGTTGTGHRAALQIDGGDGFALDSHQQVTDVQVVANTIVDNVSGIEIGRNYSSAPKDVVVAYNIVRSAPGVAVQIFKPAATVSFVGNILWTNGGGTGAALSVREAITVDPGLVKRGEVWSLSATSPAVDRAGALGAFLKEDIEGQARVIPDVGADELGTTVGARWPLSPKDVGPDAP